MLIHPEFDPAAIRIGSFAIHWYGLMYLLAFAQFLLLGRLRIRTPRYQSLGWSYKDLEDLLFAGFRRGARWAFGLHLVLYAWLLPLTPLEYF